MLLGTKFQNVTEFKYMWYVVHLFKMEEKLLKLSSLEQHIYISLNFISHCYYNRIYAQSEDFPSVKFKLLEITACL